MLAPTVTPQPLDLEQTIYADRWHSVSALVSIRRIRRRRGEFPLSDRRWSLLPRRRDQQTLEFRVEIPRDDENCLVPVWRKQARDRVVGQVHSIRALIDEKRHRRVGGGVGNDLRHFLHDERISNDEAE